MNDELVKSLTSLIDETIAEIEDLKKSRYSASEVEVGKMDSGMAGHPASGSMDKEEDKDKDKDDDDKDKDKDKDMDKAEGTNESADPGTRGVTAPAEASDPGKSNLHAEAAKAEDEDDDKKKKKDEDKDMDKAEGTSREAAPGTPGVVDDKGADPSKSNLGEEAKKSEQPAEGYHIKKATEESQELMKSYIDEKVGGLEKKLETMLTFIKELSDTPVERKGVPSHAVPLKKNDEEEDNKLSKSDVASKLFELKKSGQDVDSADIAMVETGGDFRAIADKYNLS